MQAAPGQLGNRGKPLPQIRLERLQPRHPRRPGAIDRRLQAAGDELAHRLAVEPGVPGDRRHAGALPMQIQDHHNLPKSDHRLPPPCEGSIGGTAPPTAPDRRPTSAHLGNFQSALLGSFAAALTDPFECAIWRLSPPPPGASGKSPRAIIRVTRPADFLRLCAQGSDRRGLVGCTRRCSLRPPSQIDRNFSTRGVSLCGPATTASRQLPDAGSKAITAYRVRVGSARFLEFVGKVSSRSD